MSEMKKVWLVTEECYDEGESESSAEGVFSSEENAVDYVLSRLADILEENAKYDEHLFSMPSKDDVYLRHGFEWDNGWHATCAFAITECDVDQPLHVYKEGK